MSNWSVKIHEKHLCFGRSWGVSIMLVLLLALVRLGQAQHAQIAEIIPIHEQLLLLRIEEGFVKFHAIGQLAAEDKAYRYPLQLFHASNIDNFSIQSSEDLAYTQPLNPIKIDRKSKGNYFSGRWPNYPVISQHFIYLQLSTPLQSGATYRLSVNHQLLNLMQPHYDFSIDWLSSRSESVHVNQVGYLSGSDIPKFAYIYHWAGNGGGVDFKNFEGRSFYLIDQTTDSVAFTGNFAFRGSGNLRENTRNDEPQNYTLSDVWECDWSAFEGTGRYRICVDGIGCSYPFAIGLDLYAEVFYHISRSLYFQRSGIRRNESSWPWQWPRQHHPSDGFQVQMTNIRDLGFGIETNSWANEANGTFFQNWGWYKDAGDWDAYPKHLYVPNHLLTAYELFTDRFFDGQLDLPESGNGIPDIIDEASWLLHFLKRSRSISPSGGVIARMNHFPSPPRGVASWTDMQPWYSTNEDPSSTYFYAAVAAQLANAYKLSGIDNHQDSIQIWKNEAINAFEWALENSLEEDVNNINFRMRRLLAAIWLFRITGESTYHDKIIEWNPFQSTNSWDYRWMEVIYGLATCPEIPGLDINLRQLYIDMVLDHADRWLVQPAKIRNLRMAWEMNAPSFVGLHTTPQTSAAVVAYALTGLTKYRDVVLTSIDYNLGTNPLQMCWVTGLGQERPDRGFLHLDAWYFDFIGKNEGEMIPGFIPYAHHVPGRDQTGQPTGPHNNDWALQYLSPAVNNWPIHETWQYNRQSPRTGEFTIHQNQSLAALVYASIIPPDVKFNASVRPSINFINIGKRLEASPGDTIDLSVMITNLTGYGEVTFKANGITLLREKLKNDGHISFQWRVPVQTFDEWHLSASVRNEKGDGSTAQSEINTLSSPITYRENTKMSIRLWPNPSTGDTIYLSSTQEINTADISIQDLNGRVIYHINEVNWSDPIPINIQVLPRGQYLLIVKSDNHHETLPFIRP